MVDNYKCLKGEKHIVDDKCMKWKCPYLEYKGKQIFLFHGYNRRKAKTEALIKYNDEKKKKICRKYFY